ncbi:MAG: polyprenyl synthetase family protein, partial [Cellulomonas sp.]|nr:polyprenyl synthetase family protein [Cellulomonas sp.]
DLLGRFGERVGVAFQLADDYIDLVSDGALTGKTPGTDLREGVATMPTLLLRERVVSGEADAADKALLEQLSGDLSSDAALADAVAGLRQHQVVEQTRQRSVDQADEAIDLLAPLPAGPVKDALVAFAQILVDREA